MANTSLRASPVLVSSAPGRADFLNTHQDYKGLPVVPVALDLRTYMIATKTDSPGVVEVLSMDLKERGEQYEDEFTVGERLQYAQKSFFGNYLRAIAKVALILSKKGVRELHRKDLGLHIVIKSEVPVSAGLASSAALEVAFAKLLNEVYHLQLDERRIAEVAFRAENVELGIPCGRLDQYGSSFGGVILLECKPPYRVKPIPFKDLCFVVADSGIIHSTATIHPARQAELNRGLEALMMNKSLPKGLKERLAFHYNEAKWIRLREEELAPYLSTLDEVARKRILFTLRMQRSTEIALKVMEKRLRMENALREAKNVPELTDFLSAEKGFDKDSGSRLLGILGQVMNYQHFLLRDLYDVSLPELEEIKDTMLQAGAFGAKISGAGLGGSLIGLVDSDEAGHKALNAALNAGAKQGWVSRVSTGVRIEKTGNRKIQRILKSYSA
nr:galactokinase family protein [Candidatus Njordarchaeota archaeon]